MLDKPTAARPAICLNMIVRNEAHIVTEVLDAVAPYISTWVIVDTGSNDGTQDLIRTHLHRLGIPGELHERPWHNFGHNRTEALTLAQGHADYIWVMDADDTIVGTPDFTRLDADIYWVRYMMKADIYFRSQLFRDGVPVRWVGVTHEGTTWDYQSCVEGRLEGNYHIADRQISARNLGGQKYERDRDLLLAEVERNPDDARSVFYLAQSYFDLRDFANARTWYARRAEMGGYGEEVYFALYRVAHSMLHLAEPRADIQDVFLRAWESRPTRAEPLFFMACYYREDQRYQLAYEFADWAARIPYPQQDTLFVRRHLQLAHRRRAGCVRVLPRQAGRVVHGLPARPGAVRCPRRRSATGRGQPRPVRTDHDRGGVGPPRGAGAVPATTRTRRHRRAPSA